MESESVCMSEGKATTKVERANIRNDCGNYHLLQKSHKQSATEVVSSK